MEGHLREGEGDQGTTNHYKVQDVPKVAEIGALVQDQTQVHHLQGETDRERQTDRQTDIESERQRDRQIEIENETGRYRENETLRQTHLFQSLSPRPPHQNVLK